MIYQSQPTVILRCNERNRYSLHRLMVILENLAPPAAWRIARTDAAFALELERAERPLILYSLMSTVWPAARREIRAVKRQYPRARIIAGGPHPSADPASVLAAGADTVFIGEAERSFPPFWERYVRGGDEQWPRTVEPGEPLPLDEIPPFARGGEWFAPTEITRGCAWRCHYCQTPRLFAPPVRHRGVEALTPWLTEQMRLGKKRFTALSPNALSFHSPAPGVPNLEAMEALFRAVREAGIPQTIFGAFPAEMRPDYVTEGAAKLMRQYCANRTVSIGAQAATDRMLDACGRRHTAEQVEAAARRLHAVGFIPIVDYLFGMPGETAADRQAILDQINRLIATANIKVQAHYFLPLPGTAWANAEPTPLEPEFVTAMRQLVRGGRVMGDWEEQQGLAKRMMETTESG